MYSLTDDSLCCNKQIDKICTKLAIEQIVQFGNYVILYLKNFVYQYVSLYFTLMCLMVVWFRPTEFNTIYRWNHQITKTVHLDYYLLRIHWAYWFSFLWIKTIGITEVKLLFMFDFVYFNRSILRSYETHSSIAFHIPKAKILKILKNVMKSLG